MRWYKVTELMLSQSRLLCKSTPTAENKYLFHTSYLVCKHLFGMYRMSFLCLNRFRFQQIICLLISFWTTLLGYQLSSKQVYLPQKLLGIIGSFIFLKKEENIQHFCSSSCYYFGASPGYTVDPWLSTSGIYTHVADGILCPSCDRTGEDKQPVWLSGNKHCFMLRN